MSASAETINNDITLRVPAGISSVAGPLNLGGSFNASNYAWKASGSGNVSFSGSISGSGLITRDGTGTLILAGANSFSGDLAINSLDSHRSLTARGILFGLYGRYGARLT